MAHRWHGGPTYTRWWWLPLFDRWHDCRCACRGVGKPCGPCRCGR